MASSADTSSAEAVLSLDEVLAQTVEVPERICSFEGWMRKISDGQRAAVEGWIDSLIESRKSGRAVTKGAITGTWISTQLSRAGIQFTSDQINRHVREPKDCGCSRAN